MPEEQPAPYGRSGTCLPWHGAESNCNYSLLINSSAGKWGRAPSGGCGARGSHPTGTSPTSTVPPAHLTPRAGAPSPGSPPRAQHTPPRAPTSCRAASSPPTRGSPHLQPLLAVVYGPSLLRCSINSLTRSCFPRWRRDKAIGRKRALVIQKHPAAAPPPSPRPCGWSPGREGSLSRRSPQQHYVQLLFNARFLPVSLLQPPHRSSAAPRGSLPHPQLPGGQHRRWVLRQGALHTARAAHGSKAALCLGGAENKEREPAQQSWAAWEPELPRGSASESG